MGFCRLRRGASTEQERRRGRAQTCLQFNGDVNVVQILFNNGAKVKGLDGRGRGNDAGIDCVHYYLQSAKETSPSNTG